MLTRYLPPSPHFTVNVHFLTSETIEVRNRRDRAKGRWIMLQASGYVDGKAELISARLEVDFVPAARWRATGSSAISARNACSTRPGKSIPRNRTP